MGKLARKYSVNLFALLSITPDMARDSRQHSLSSRVQTPTLLLNPTLSTEILNAHELYVLAESPDLRSTASSTKRRVMPYRLHAANRERIEVAARRHKSPVEHVAVLGEN